MLRFRICGEPHVPSRRLQGAHHALSPFERDDSVFLPVKCPGRDILQHRHLVRISPGAYRCDRGEHVRVSDRRIPCPETAPAQPGQVDPGAVDPEVFRNVPDKCLQDRRRPVLLLRALRRNEYERVFLSLFHPPGRPVFLDEVQIGSPFPRSVKKQNERPLRRPLIIILRQVQKVPRMDIERSAPLENASFLISRHSRRILYA